jgi:hypothetical protein
MAFLEAVEAEPDKIRGHTALFLRQALMTLLFVHHQLPSLFARTARQRSHYQRGQLFVDLSVILPHAAERQRGAPGRHHEARGGQLPGAGGSRLGRLLDKHGSLPLVLGTWRRIQKICYVDKIRKSI